MMNESLESPTTKLQLKQRTASKEETQAVFLVLCKEKLVHGCATLRALSSPTPKSKTSVLRVCAGCEVRSSQVPSPREVGFQSF